MASLNGKVALVTGGAKNLGAEVARELAKINISSLALHYNSAASGKEAEALKAEFAQKYPKVNVRFYQGDLTKVANVEQLFQSVVKDFGHIDIVINTVGKVLKKPIVDTTEKEYDDMFAVNTKSAFFITKESAKHVKEGGKIINVITALLGAFTPLYSTYAGSKVAVEHISRAVAKELQSKNISVNCIAPGPMDTPFFYAQETPESVQYLKAQSFDNRLTDIKDIAPLIRFVAAEGGWISGQTIFANGGFTTR